MKKILKLSIFAIFPVLFLTFQNFTTVPTTPEKFKIIWHIGSAIEPLADASDDRLNLINNLKTHVDGYYFLVLNKGSLLTYWKGRPFECMINYKSLKWKSEDGDGPVSVTLNGREYGQATKERCAAQLEAYQAKLWVQSGKKLTFKQFQIALHENALKRVLTNLNIKGEQAAGKRIMSEMIVRGGDNGNFVYNRATDKISLVKKDGVVDLPKSYGFLKANGIIPDRLMTYQEPRPQSENDSLLRVPLVKGGPTEYVPGEIRCDWCLPHNLRVIDMLANALEAEMLKVPRMAINIRTWDENSVASIKQQLLKHPSKFDGINIEGSSHKFAKASYDRSVEGAAWMLRNTSKPISFLIPGALFEDETDTQEMRDEKYIQHFLEYVTALNADLNKKLNLPLGKNALCNSRLSLIVGSYGSPLHMESFPLFRHDDQGNRIRRAGTVGSEILVLKNYRDKLCK